MFIMRKETEGFTFLGLMIIVAVLALIGASLWPSYQRQVQKSLVTAKVLPGMHSIETNFGTLQSLSGAEKRLTVTDDVLELLVSDADTTCFTPSFSGSTLILKFDKPDTCPDLKTFKENTLTATPQFSENKVIGWKLGGEVAARLGISD